MLILIIWEPVAPSKTSNSSPDLKELGSFLSDISERSTYSMINSPDNRSSEHHMSSFWIAIKKKSSSINLNTITINVPI